LAVRKSRVLIIGMRRVGKSNLLAVLFEEFARYGFTPNQQTELVLENLLKSPPLLFRSHSKDAKTKNTQLH